MSNSVHERPYSLSAFFAREIPGVDRSQLASERTMSVATVQPIHGLSGVNVHEQIIPAPRLPTLAWVGGTRMAIWTLIDQTLLPLEFKQRVECRDVRDCLAGDPGALLACAGIRRSASRRPTALCIGLQNRARRRATRRHFSPGSRKSRRVSGQPAARRAVNLFWGARAMQHEASAAISAAETGPRQIPGRAC